MWSNALTFQHDTHWGYHLCSLTDEGHAVVNGQAYAALLNGISLIRVSGEDAESFLQGQITCDIKLATQGQPVLGAHCNIKGRAQATFLVLFDRNHYYLIIPSNLADATITALKPFALFSKVTMALDDSLLPIGFGGKQKALGAFLPASFGALPEPGCIAQTEHNLIAHHPHVGLMGFVAKTQVDAFLKCAQDSSLRLCGDNAWHLSQIRNGVAHIQAQLTETLIPQEFNYDAIDGINFKKGCYKGQEIIARIHYRGKSKNRAGILVYQGDRPTRIGEALFDSTAPDKRIGTIIDSAFVNDGTQMLLACLRQDSLDSQNLCLIEKVTGQLQILPLPYAIT